MNERGELLDSLFERHNIIVMHKALKIMKELWKTQIRKQNMKLILKLFTDKHPYLCCYKHNILFFGCLLIHITSKEFGTEFFI